MRTQMNISNTGREEGMNYWFPNLFWSLLCVIFGMPPTVLIWAAVLGEDVPFLLAVPAYVIWTGGWTVLCVWLGGLNVLVITLAVHFGPLIIGVICFRYGPDLIQICLQCECPSFTSSTSSSSSSSSSSSGKPTMPTYNYGGNEHNVVEMPNVNTSLPVATAVYAG